MTNRTICNGYAPVLLAQARGECLPPQLQLNLREHLLACTPCQIRLEGQLRLSLAAASLAAESAEISIPPAVELILKAEFIRVRTSPVRRPPQWAVLGAVAALAIAAVSLPQTPPPPPVASVPRPAAISATPLSAEQPVPIQRPRPPRSLAPKPLAPEPHAQEQRQVAGTEPEQPFVPLPYTAPLAPYEHLEIVRMNLPVAALIAAGFSLQVSDLGALAQADVVISADGRTRAVRVISVSDSSSNSYRSIK